VNAPARIRAKGIPRQQKVDQACERAKPWLEEIAAVEFAPDGTIRVLGRAAFPAAAPKDEFESWAQSGKLD